MTVKYDYRFVAGWPFAAAWWWLGAVSEVWPIFNEVPSESFSIRTLHKQYRRRLPPQDARTHSADDIIAWPGQPANWLS